jgi:hypothetical protein
MQRLAVIALVAVVAGCGSEPLDPPDLDAVRTPRGAVKMRDPRTGVRFEAPRNWVRRIRSNPGMFRIASADADVSGWAYPRAEQLPETDAELEAARDALVEHAKKRNPTFQVSGSEITEVQNWPAVEVRGTQTVLGKQVQTRSIHIYRAGEYVIEALAPPEHFELTDKRVFEPLLRSLRFRPLPPGS